MLWAPRCRYASSSPTEGGHPSDTRARNGGGTQDKQVKGFGGLILILPPLATPLSLLNVPGGTYTSTCPPTKASVCSKALPCHPHGIPGPGDRTGPRGGGRNGYRPRRIHLHQVCCTVRAALTRPAPPGRLSTQHGTCRLPTEKMACAGRTPLPSGWGRHVGPGPWAGHPAFSFFFLPFCHFLEPLPWHMEVPRLGVESEL